MTNKSMNCGRFAELLSQINRQVPIPPPERQLMEVHEQACETCRVDAQLSRLMNSDEMTPVNELADRRRIEWAISYAGQQEQTAEWMNSPPEQAHRPWLWVAAAALLLLGVSGWIFGSVNAASEDTFQRAWGGKTTAVIRFNDGRALGSALLEVGLRQNRFGMSAAVSVKPVSAAGLSLGNEAESTFAAMASGIDVALEPDSRLTVIRATEAELRIRLTSGHLLAKVNPEVPHPNFVVETPKGNVTVKGTIFSISVVERVCVDVLRGKVAVSYDGHESFVTKDSGFEFDTQTMYAIAPTHKQVLSRRLRLLEQTVREHKIQILSEAGRKNTAIDAHDMSHFASSQGAFGKTDTDAAQSVEKNASSQARAETADALLRTAREQKAARNWAGALDAYESIIKTYPNTSVASSSRIAAGNLRLKFGDARGALAHFNGYLQQPNAPLKEEAMFGKIKSLRRLNEVTQELAAMRLFVSLFPKSLHAASMQKRITMLELTEE